MTRIGTDEELRRSTPPTDLTDQQLWVAFMAEDRELAYGAPDDDRHAALTAEIAVRFGPDATERTATWSVYVRASSDDLVTWARDSFPHLRSVATGDDDYEGYAAHDA